MRGTNKPRILLSVNTKKEYYVDAVNAAGGIAVAEYCPAVRAEGFDGLILCGGNDIDPAYYGEEMGGAVDIDHARDKAEFALFEAFMKAGKPIFGICRGEQLLNVAFGGSLYQHIANAELHTDGKSTDVSHLVRAEKGSICARLYGDEFAVNSAHHQAVKVLGKGLCLGMTADGVVEGFEHETLPVIGVQWHPERMCCSAARPDTVDGGKIFSYFIDLCRK